MYPRSRKYATIKTNKGKNVKQQEIPILLHDYKTLLTVFPWRIRHRMDRRNWQRTVRKTMTQSLKRIKKKNKRLKGKRMRLQLRRWRTRISYC